jgi:transcription antitermination factor NusG
MAAPAAVYSPSVSDQYHCEAGLDVPRWYAVYTWSRHEKMVARHFEERGITYFLPLYSSIHQWNKRMAAVSLPLFPGYVFVQTPWHRRHRPLEVPGVVHFVGAAKSPTEIPGAEIELLRNAVLSGRRIEPHPYLAPGNRVRIASGPMAGLTGIIERTAAGCRIVISVDMIMRSVAVELDAASLVAES